MLPLLVAYGVLALLVGSFLNVCIYRIPRGESIVFPASHCPHCGRKIRPWDNVPLLAYVWLRGRCRDCHAPISLQYPGVELLNCVAWTVCALQWKFAAPTFVNSFLLSILLVLFLIDYQHQILPNVITLPGTAAGILISPFQSSALFADALSRRAAAGIFPGGPDWAVPMVGAALGAAVGSGLLLAVSYGYEKLRGVRGLGLGDVKMMALVGAFLGWPQVLLSIFLGSFAGAVIGILLMLFGGRTLQSRMPFGTFLGIGAALALFFGPSFFAWYLSIR